MHQITGATEQPSLIHKTTQHGHPGTDGGQSGVKPAAMGGGQTWRYLPQEVLVSLHFTLKGIVS